MTDNNISTVPLTIASAPTTAVPGTQAVSQAISGIDDKSNILPKLLAQQLMEKVSQINTNKQQEAVMQLLNHIAENKSKTNDKFFILSAAYDKLYKKYNNISLLILILSSVVTLVEAFRLSIVDFVNKSDDTDKAHVEIISFCMNLITLFTGTIITVLSSIIRFKNYREILEQLKDKQNLLISYREKYSKKYEKILNLLAFDCLTKEDVVSIQDRIIEYDNDIKTINVMEYLRNEDILKFNKYKAHFDFEMYKMDIDKDIAIKKYEKSVGITLNEIKKEEIKSNNTGYMNMRGLKEFLLKRTKNTDKNTVISPNIL